MKHDRGDSRPLAVPSGRMARMTRLGVMASGVAGNMTLNGLRQWGKGQRPAMRDLLLVPGNIRRIADELAHMRGAAMKMGQLISMDGGDVLPPELADILARLRADAHFMPPRQLKQVLNDQWGDGWLRQVAHFNVRPIAAASIGQVHRVKFHDGRDLAVKVQYPGVARSIDSDVSNVGMLLRMSGLLPGGFDIAPYLAEARRQLHEETDYAREARALTAYRTQLDDTETFIVPGFHADWSTGAILAMTYVDGVPIETLTHAPQEVRDRVARVLFDLMLRELFDFGLMQTDPNFANYRYDDKTRRIVLLDFGAARRLSPDTAPQYRALMRAGLAADRAALDEAASRIGFVDAQMRADHRTRALDMIQAVFDAIRATPSFDFAHTDLTRHLNAEGAALADEGMVPPTPAMDALYLQRKFGGMFLLAARLRARVPVSALLERWI